MLPRGLERPIPTGMLHVMNVLSGKGQRGPPLRCPTLPVAPFLPPFPHFSRQYLGSGGGIQCLGGGRKPPFPLGIDCRTPPSIGHVGSWLQLEGLDRAVLGRSYLLNGVLGALWTPPSMDGGVHWKVMITGINHLENE